jgi:Uma2 family endonuclease
MGPMAAALTLSHAPGPSLPVPAEQRLMLRGISWASYVSMRELLDGPSPRMTYLEGALELMSPSPLHEIWKKNIARLLELYAYLVGIDVRGYGNTTFKREDRERGAEPDECYVIGQALTDFPQMVLEVVHTVPLIDKRAVYAAMGVLELWVFEGGAFTLYGLDAASESYVPRPRSIFFPALDFAVVARYAVRDLTLDALREFAAEATPGG